MTTNYREQLGIKKLSEAIGIAKEDRNLKQKKAIKNIKYCANDQWMYVNGWYDEKSESCRQLMMNPRELFERIYSESLVNVYDEGFCGFGGGAEAYLKDIRFCGKAFLEKVTFFYLAKLLEESVPEVDGTEEDAIRVLEELKKIQAEVYAA